MEHGITLLAILHIFVALIMVSIILIQDSKGGGMGGAFGGGGSQTLFGASGATNFLVKVTRTLAVIFMCTCIALTLIITHQNSRSVVDTVPAGTATTQPFGSKATAPAAPNTNQVPAAPGKTSPSGH